MYGRPTIAMQYRTLHYVHRAIKSGEKSFIYSKNLSWMHLRRLIYSVCSKWVWLGSIAGLKLFERAKWGPTTDSSSSKMASDILNWRWNLLLSGCSSWIGLRYSSNCKRRPVTSCTHTLLHLVRFCFEIRCNPINARSSSNILYSRLLDATDV